MSNPIKKLEKLISDGYILQANRLVGNAPKSGLKGKIVFSVTLANPKTHFMATEFGLTLREAIDNTLATTERITSSNVK